MSTLSITQLSARIAENTAKFNDYLSSRDLLGPSSGMNAPKLVCHAISAYNLFAEPRPGTVAYSAASRLLAEEVSRTPPADVADRVAFIRHDFFTPQPYAVEILRNLIPALKPRAAVVVNDLVVPEAGSASKPAELTSRTSDLVQVVLQNAGDRELGDWVKLFEAADPKFKMMGANPMPGSTRLWTIHVEWEDA
ncbi:hypothetical protein B0T25DRAFT_571141 [Lasiosphaeria hispida]|uniref:O-methyltransferase n=1 Tax=Lasiosphaeria hispida TaxID=260671 RepID=A0AAJ0MAB1_9PEZI|nr:hypothetical protein B0T25DRAFT_571141 [Lasiosphaeria hispida]